MYEPPRSLTEDEEAKLASQQVTLAPVKIGKLEKEASKNWDKFYMRNTTNFYKDRHWLFREFEPLSQMSTSKNDTLFAEIGCGVGNAFFPIMEICDGKIKGVACDFSQRAVDFVRNHNQFDPERMTAFQCDIVEDVLSFKLDPGLTFDIATLIFVLSAIDPNKVSKAVENVYDVMKNDGKVCVRDYAVNDHAMIRFGARGHKLAERFYVRQDNTRAYYFYMQELVDIFEKIGFHTISAEYKESKTVNHQKELSVDRYFVQAVFQK